MEKFDNIVGIVCGDLCCIPEGYRLVLFNLLEIKSYVAPRILNGKRSGTSYMLLCVSTDCSAPSGSVAQDAYQNLYRAEH